MGDPINDLVKGFSKNELIGYFLILWAVTFILSAADGFIWLAGGNASIADLIVEGLWNMVDIGCGAILILLGFKILNEKQ
jgi:threonine/homoserine/homoserine lactone efflux protein